MDKQDLQFIENELTKITERSKAKVLNDSRIPYALLAYMKLVRDKGPAKYYHKDDVKEVADYVKKNIILDEKQNNRIFDYLVKKYPKLTNRNEAMQLIGKCDAASNHIIAEVNDLAHKLQIPIHAQKIHGELRHNNHIPSKSWDSEHTIVEVMLGPYRWYLDATCFQFASIIRVMPKIYVGRKVPKWFYPDRRNPRWMIPKSFMKKYPKIDDIITHIDYDIWGRICDKYFKPYKK